MNAQPITTPVVWPERFWLAGCGAMAGAMLGRWLDAGLPPQSVTVIRPSGSAVGPGIRVLTSPPEHEPAPDLLMLGFKPQQLGGAAADLQRACRGSLVVSLLAGARLPDLAAAFPGARALVRAMPNLAVAQGKGVVGLFATDTGARERIAALMAPLGWVEPCAQEDDMDRVAALAGSGPAYWAALVDAFAQAGVQSGLAPEDAARMARATLIGTAALLDAEPDLSPDALIDRVASKGGSTRAGLSVMNSDDRAVGLMADTLTAAVAHNRILATLARENAMICETVSPPSRPL